MPLVEQELLMFFVEFVLLIYVFITITGSIPLLHFLKDHPRHIPAKFAD